LGSLGQVSASRNTLGDFPSDTFTLFAFCESCGHSSAVDRVKAPDNLDVQALRGRLRCGACGVRQASIRIVYTAAGGFQYGAGERLSLGTPAE